MTKSTLHLTPALALLLALGSSGCGTAPPPPAKTNAAKQPASKGRAPLGQPCESDDACAHGLTCASREGKVSEGRKCLARQCQALGSSEGCPAGTVCCPLLPGVHDGPMCLPKCGGKPAGYCRELLGANAVCNQEAGCCFFEKVRRRSPVIG